MSAAQQTMDGMGASAASEQTGSTSRGRSTPPQAPSAFRAYFNSLSATRRLTPKQERACARALVQARTDLYQALVSHRPARAVIARQLEAHVGTADVVARLRDPSADAPAVAQALFDLDRDSTTVRTLVDEVVRRRPAHGDDELGWFRFRRRCEAALASWLELRHEFVNSNLGLVVALAGRYRSERMSLLDLVQEGNTGLLKAVARFDPERGVRFSTYAAWWIRHEIGRALSNKSRQVRLPVHIVERQSKIERARQKFLAWHGRSPDPGELAQRCKLTQDKIEEADRSHLAHARGYSVDAGCVETYDVEGLPAELTDPDREIDGDRYREALRNALGSLSGLHLDIVRSRFGLDGRPAVTLREVGERHALSRERIRQLQNQALAVLRRELQREGF